MVYLLDILVIVFFAIAVWNGYRHGFIRAISSLIALVAAALLAPVFSTPLATAVYDRQIGPAIQQTVLAQVQVTGESAISDGFDSALEQLPGFLQNVLANNGIASGADLATQFGANSNAELEVMVENVTNEMIRPLLLSLLETAASVLLVIVLFFLITLLLRLVDKFFKLPLLSNVNKLLGLIPGAINGIISVLILVTVVQTLAAVSPATAPINQTVLEGTVLTEWIATINPIAGAMQELLAAGTKTLGAIQ